MTFLFLGNFSPETRTLNMLTTCTVPCCGLWGRQPEKLYEIRGTRPCCKSPQAAAARVRAGRQSSASGSGGQGGSAGQAAAARGLRGRGVSQGGRRAPRPRSGALSGALHPAGLMGLVGRRRLAGRRGGPPPQKPSLLRGREGGIFQRNIGRRVCKSRVGPFHAPRAGRPGTT